MKKTFNRFGLDVKTMAMLILGNLSLIIGINFFMVPSNLIPTGLSGFAYELSIILDHFIEGIPINELLNSPDVNYGLIFFILNVPIIIFGFLKVGKKFVFKTLFSVISFSIISVIIPVYQVIPIQTSGDQFVAAIVGGIFVGAGIGLSLKVGGSSGGTDIIAVFISIYKGKSFGLYNFLINSVVIAIGIILYQDIAVGVIVLFHLYICNIVISKVHNNHDKHLLIIYTKKPGDIADKLRENFYRGITVLDGHGGHSKKQINTMLISVSKEQIHSIGKIAREVDENCFINVLKIENILGYFIDTYKETL